LELRVQLEAGEDPEAVDELTARLRRQLLELDVDAVERPSAGEPPPGTRGLETLALGTLIVKLARTPELLGMLTGAVRSWLSTQGKRTVKLEIDGDVIEVTGVSSSQQDRLIEAWIERNAAA
jgi:hypothetical protein